MATMTFKRHEAKYMLTAKQYSLFSQALKEHTVPDQYGSYTICSIYFDTDDYAVIRHSMSKPEYKEKLRLRSYGTPGAGDKVFLELKKKYEGITYKRRIQLPYVQAERYLSNGIAPEQQGQIFRELDWYIQEKRPAPKVLLSYDRTALVSREDTDLRITFDTNIRWRTNALDLSKGDHGQLLIPPGNRVLEIKAAQSFPLWLSQLLTWQQLYPVSFSKYATVYQNHLCSLKEVRHAG